MDRDVDSDDETTKCFHKKVKKRHSSLPFRLEKPHSEIRDQEETEEEEYFDPGVDTNGSATAAGPVQVTPPTAVEPPKASFKRRFINFVSRFLTEMRRNFFRRISFAFAFWQTLTLLGLNVSLVEFLPFLNSPAIRQHAYPPSYATVSSQSSLPRRQAPSPLPFERYLFPAPVGLTTPRMLRREFQSENELYNVSTNIFDAYNGSMRGLRSTILSSDVVFMIFYAQWCYFSNLAWQALARPAQHYKNRVSFVGINCWTNRGDGTCRKKFRVSQFPWLGVHFQGRTIPYEHAMSEFDLFHFVERFASPIRTVNSELDFVQVMRGGQFYTTDAALLFCQAAGSDSTAKNELLQTITENFLSLNVMLSRAMPRMTVQFLMSLNDGCDLFAHFLPEAEVKQQKISDFSTLFLIRPYFTLHPVQRLELVDAGNWTLIRTLLSHANSTTNVDSSGDDRKISSLHVFSYYYDLFNKHISMNTVKDFSLSMFLTSTSNPYAWNDAERNSTTADEIENELNENLTGKLKISENVPDITNLLRNSSKSTSQLILLTPHSFREFNQNSSEIFVNNFLYEHSNLYQTWRLVQFLYQNCPENYELHAPKHAQSLLHAVFDAAEFDRTAWHAIHGLKCRKNLPLEFFSVDHVPFQAIQNILGDLTTKPAENGLAAFVFVYDADTNKISLFENEPLSEKNSYFSDFARFVLRYVENSTISSNQMLKSSNSHDIFRKMTARAENFDNAVQIFDLSVENLRYYVEAENEVTKKCDLIVFYYTRWCGACKRAYSAFKQAAMVTLQNLALLSDNKIDHKTIFARIDIDENQLPTEYAVKHVPKMRIFAGELQQISTFPADSGLPLSSSGDGTVDGDEFLSTDFAVPNKNSNRDSFFNQANLIRFIQQHASPVLHNALNRSTSVFDEDDEMALENDDYEKLADLAHRTCLLYLSVRARFLNVPDGTHDGATDEEFEYFFRFWRAKCQEAQQKLTLSLERQRRKAEL